MSNTHENCKTDRQTQPVTDLPLTIEQAEETKAGLRGTPNVHEISVTKVTD
jgi:hypothetical protein